MNVFAIASDPQAESPIAPGDARQVGRHTDCAVTEAGIVAELHQRLVGRLFGREEAPEVARRRDARPLVFGADARDEALAFVAPGDGGIGQIDDVVADGREWHGASLPNDAQ